MRVFVTGASGFIGRALCRALLSRGDEVVGVSRRGDVEPGVEAVKADPAQPGAWRDKVAGCHAVFHLAGEPVAGKRWNDEHKRLLRASRVDSGGQIAQAIAAQPPGRRPRVLITSSGVDYYPFDKSEHEYREDELAGHTFLADLCRAWEGATAQAAERTVALRTGVVLGHDEGALAKLVTPFRLFLGGPVGSGEQWTSWIHIEDVVGAALFALDRDAVRGPVNLVAASARQRDFAEALGDALKRPAWLPVPGLALRVVIGELAEYILHGRKVVPSALAAAGFEFRYPELRAALATLV